MAKYQKLVEPFKIGNVELRNRFVMLPMTIEKVDNYHVTDDLVDFYEQRAKGHAGLIEIGSCYVCDCFGTEPKYHTTTGACGCWDDEFIPGFQRIAEVCHKHGSKVAAQLQLCYEWRASGDDPLLSYAPSKDVPSGPFVGMPEREYTKEEIAEVVKQYGQAARRCKDAGIDIIEIHAGIGYMVMRFLSKYSNHRTDEYGGSAENRARFLCEIIDEIHKTCGDDMPILVRISADDLMPDGNRIAEIRRVLVYTFIYEGVANWQQADATVTIRYPGAEDLIVKMDSFNSSDIMCGLVLLENVNNETFSVEKIVQFYKGHEALDQAFHWGMRWKAGRK